MEGWNQDARLCFFKIHRTITRMLHDRGYEVEDEELEMTVDTFDLTYLKGTPDELNHIYVHKDTNARVKVKYDAPDSKILKPHIETLLAEIQADQVKHCIFIVMEGTLSKPLRTALDKRPSGIRFEIFERKEVMINITEHELVPKHTVMSPEEKRALLDRYQVQDSQLPRIMRDDPVVRYLGADPGTVIEIKRKSETAGRYVTYRLVC